MPAANALIAVPTKCGRAATLDRAKRFELGPGERIAITLEELVACSADDIGHLEGGWSVRYKARPPTWCNHCSAPAAWARFIVPAMLPSSATSP